MSFTRLLLTCWILARLLDFLFGTKLVDDIVELPLDLKLNHGFLYFDGVDVGLVEEETVDCNLFWNNTIGIAHNLLTVVEQFLICLLDVGLVDGLVANHPCHFLDDIVGSSGDECGGNGQNRCRQYDFFLHFVPFYVE